MPKSIEAQVIGTQVLRSGTSVGAHVREGKPGQETGYSLEVFNAVGETIAVLVVEESKINPVKGIEILHVRRLDKVAAL